MGKRKKTTDYKLKHGPDAERASKWEYDGDQLAGAKYGTVKRQAITFDPDRANAKIFGKAPDLPARETPGIGADASSEAMKPHAYGSVSAGEGNTPSETGASPDKKPNVGDVGMLLKSLGLTEPQKPIPAFVNVGSSSSSRATYRPQDLANEAAKHRDYADAAGLAADNILVDSAAQGAATREAVRERDVSQERLGDARAEQMEETQAALAANDQRYQTEIDKGIDPKRWWSSKSFGQKALFLFGRFLADYGSGLQGRAPQTMKIMQGMIDRDVALQQGEQKKQLTALAREKGSILTGSQLKRELFSLKQGAVDRRWASLQFQLKSMADQTADGRKAEGLRMGVKHIALQRAQAQAQSQMVRRTYSSRKVANPALAAMKPPKELPLTASEKETAVNQIIAIKRLSDTLPELKKGMGVINKQIASRAPWNPRSAVYRQMNVLARTLGKMIETRLSDHDVKDYKKAMAGRFDSFDSAATLLKGWTSSLLAGADARLLINTMAPPAHRAVLKRGYDGLSVLDVELGNTLAKAGITYGSGSSVPPELKKKRAIWKAVGTPARELRELKRQGLSDRTWPF